MYRHDFPNASQPCLVQGTRNPAQHPGPRKAATRRPETGGKETPGAGRRGEEERSRGQVRRREAKVRTGPDTWEASRDKCQHGHPSVHNNESLEDTQGYFVIFSGERPKSRFGHIVRDSYPQIVHFGFLEARLVTCS